MRWLPVAEQADWDPSISFHSNVARNTCGESQFQRKIIQKTLSWASFQNLNWMLWTHNKLGKRQQHKTKFSYCYQHWACCFTFEHLVQFSKTIADPWTTKLKRCTACMLPTAVAAITTPCNEQWHQADWPYIFPIVFCVAIHIDTPVPVRTQQTEQKISHEKIYRMNGSASAYFCLWQRNRRRTGKPQ